jgi:hypothetical protein
VIDKLVLSPMLAAIFKIALAKKREKVIIFFDLSFFPEFRVS